MEVLKREVELPKENEELVRWLGDVVEKAVKATSDGWQAGQDLPVILTGSINGLLDAVKGLDKLPGEYKEAPVMAVTSWVLLGNRVMTLLKEQKEKKGE